MKTTTTQATKMDSDVHALVRSLKQGSYGVSFWHGVYTEAERRGLVVYVTGEGYRAA